MEEELHISHTAGGKMLFIHVRNATSVFTLVALQIATPVSTTKEISHSMHTHKSHLPEVVPMFKLVTSNFKSKLIH
jgi:hypothetical protein